MKALIISPNKKGKGRLVKAGGLLDATRSKIKSMRGRIEELEEDKILVESWAGNLEKENEELVQKLFKFEEEYINMEKENSELKKKNEDLRLEFASFKKGMTSKNLIRKLTGEEGGEGQVFAEGSQLFDIDLEENVRREMSKMAKVNKKLSNDLENLKLDLKRARGKEKRLKEEHKKFEISAKEERMEYEERIAELVNGGKGVIKSSGRTQKLEYLKDTSNELQSKLSEVEGECARLQKENDRLQDSRENLEKKIEDLQEQGSFDLKKKKDVFNEKLKAIEKSTTMKLEKFKDLIKNFENSEAEYKFTIADLNSKVEEMKEELESANKKFEEKNLENCNELKNLEEEKSYLAQSLSETLDKNQDLNDKIHKLELEKEKLEASINNQKDEIKVRLKEIDDIGYDKAEKENLKIELNNAKAEMDEMSQKLIAKESQIDDLNKDINLKNEDISNLKSTLSTLEQEVLAKDKRFIKMTEEIKKEKFDIQRGEQIPKSKIEAKTQKGESETKTLRSKLERVESQYEEEINLLTRENDYLYEKLKKLEEGKEGEGEDGGDRARGGYQGEGYSPKEEILRLKRKLLKTETQLDREVSEKEHQRNLFSKKIEDLEDEIFDLNKEKQERSWQESMRDSQLDLTQLASRDLSEQMYELRQENKLLKKRYYDLKNKYEERLSDVFNKIEALNEEKASWEAIANLNSDEEKYKKIKKRLRSKSKELESIRKELESVQRKLAFCQNEKLELEKKIERDYKKVDDLINSAEFSGSGDTVDKCKKALNYIIQKNKVIESRYKKLANEYKQLVSRETTSINQEEVEKIQNEVRELTRENQRMHEKILQQCQLINDLNSREYLYRKLMKKMGIKPP